MEPKFKNWDNFCGFYLGEWHGIWTRYSVEGEEIESLRSLRNSQLSEEGDEIHTQLNYTYADGTTEAKPPSTFKKPTVNGLCLENSCSWGSPKVKPGSPFGFDTGFRQENWRWDVLAKYDASGGLERLTVVSEHLNRAAKPSLPSVDGISGNWQGTVQTMTPDCIVVPPETTSWKKLEELASDSLTLHFSDGISVSCPKQLELENEFFLAVDWRVNSTVLKRGIRHYKSSEFTHYTLELFTLSS